MKKIYLFLAASFMVATAFGQTTTVTLTQHFQGAINAANPAASQVGIYNWTGGNGYVSGSNSYGDQAIVELFDDNYGVTADGTVDNVKLMVGYKSMAATPGTVTVAVWENNGGAIGNVIASEVVNLADIDTVAANAQLIMPTTGQIDGIYNLDVTFTTPAVIPANHSFWAGVILPTAIADGDSLALLTTLSAYNFVDANTHAGSMDGTGAFASYGSSTLNISNAIFPTVTLDGSASLIEEVKANTVLYPNPVNNTVTIDFGTSEVTSVNILNINGQVVMNASVVNGSVSLNASNLESGIYLYQAVGTNGTVLNTSKFVKQ